MSRNIVIMCTFGSRENATKVTKFLLESRLAACVQLVPIESHYWWQEKIENEKEILVLIKTHMEKYQEIQNSIARLHTYQLPEITYFEISGGESQYLAWIASSISSGNT